MRSIAKAQYGMSRKLRRQYMNPMRCKSPNEPGCGAKRAERKQNREINRANRQSEREERREKRRTPAPSGIRGGIPDYPKIVKREYLREDDDRPGTPSGYDRQKKMWKGENVAGGQNQAKKGTKLKGMVKAKTGTKAKAKYGAVAKKVSKKGSRK